jgi:hypothetical protein
VLGPYEWPQHTKKAFTCDGLCDYLTCRSGKEFESSFHRVNECDALVTLGYFFLGSGKPDPEVIRKTHPRSILAFSKAVGLG